MGLTFEDAQRLGGYGGIAVAPMITDGRLARIRRYAKPRFRGCVSIDGPISTFKTLNQQKVRELVKDCANTCAFSLYHRPEE